MEGSRFLAARTGVQTNGLPKEEATLMLKSGRIAAGLLVASVVTFGQSKPSIAVDAFDYSTVMTSVQAVFGTQVNIGQGIRAMMVKRITDEGNFTVVERAKVDNLLKEQDFGASGRVKQGTQARIGQIRGAALAVMGDIITFGRDDDKKGGALGGFGGGIVGAIAGARKTDKAVVVLNYRLVNVETSEILAAGEARGESKRTSTSLGGMLAGWRGGAGAAVDFNSSNFQETIIGEATMAAVDQIAMDLNSKYDLISANMPELDIEGRVAAVNGNSLIINVGSNDGVQVGDQFQVLHVGQEIKDPVTGEVLDVLTTPLGSMTIVDVRERIATGNYSGPEVVVGDMVKK